MDGDDDASGGGDDDGNDASGGGSEDGDEDDGDGFHFTWSLISHCHILASRTKYGMNVG